MKKSIIYLLFIIFLAFVVSCDSEGIVHPNTSNSDETGSNAGNDANPQGDTPDEIGIKDVIEVKSSSETIDEVTYVTKDYAHLETNEPYFYTYYRVYYLDGKVRRVHVWSHEIGSCLNYPYDDFEEHLCSQSNTKYIHTYYENGFLEYSFYYTLSQDNPDYISSYTQTHYREDGTLEYMKFYEDYVLYHEYQYNDNGRIESQIYCFGKDSNNPGAENYRYEYDYYDDNSLKEKRYYSGGLLTGYTLYSISGRPFEYVPNYNSNYTYKYYYFDSGILKKKEEYLSDVLYSEAYYYETTTTVKRSSVEYNDSGVRRFDIYYESGRSHYYWSYNNLQTYEDVDNSSYTSQSYSEEQALELLSSYID